MDWYNPVSVGKVAWRNQAENQAAAVHPRPVLGQDREIKDGEVNIREGDIIEIVLNLIIMEAQGLLELQPMVGNDRGIVKADPEVMIGKVIEAGTQHQSHPIPGVETAAAEVPEVMVSGVKEEGQIQTVI